MYHPEKTQKLNSLSMGTSPYYTKQLITGFRSLNDFVTDTQRIFLHVYPELAVNYPKFDDNTQEIINDNIKLRISDLATKILAAIISQTSNKKISAPTPVYLFPWNKYTSNLQQACWEQSRTGFLHKKLNGEPLFTQIGLDYIPQLEEITQDDLMFSNEDGVFVCHSKKAILYNFSQHNFNNPYTKKPFAQEFIDKINTVFSAELAQPGLESVDYTIYTKASINPAATQASTKPQTTEIALAEYLEAKKTNKPIVVFIYRPELVDKNMRAVQDTMLGNWEMIKEGKNAVFLKIKYDNTSAQWILTQFGKKINEIPIFILVNDGKQEAFTTGKPPSPNGAIFAFNKLKEKLKKL